MALYSKQLLLLLVVAILIAATSTAPTLNCPTNCGHVSIPFPFGITEKCSLDSSFLIDCNQTSSTPFLPQTNLSVLSISLEGELRVSFPVASDCPLKQVNLTYFHLSSRRNKLTAVGCSMIGVIVGRNSSADVNYTTGTGCISLCSNPSDLKGYNGPCTGNGCCQIAIPEVLPEITYGSIAFSNDSGVVDFNPCGYGFLVEDGAYKFSHKDLTKLEKTTFPVVLDWSVGNKTCQQAQKDGPSYACKSENSTCYPSTERQGYLCNCSHGFHGNPYVLHGCQDVDECSNMEFNDCVDGAECYNLTGSYNCRCPEGYEGDGRKDGTRCSSKPSTNMIMIIALSVSISLLALLMGGFYVYWASKKRKMVKLKEQFFQQNGGFLLQQQIGTHRGSTETAKVFTVEELKEATNNFDESKVLGQGGYGTVYKGVLQDNRIVAIKKSKISDLNQIEQFINEVIVLSQINHRNVVKLLGCCLETEVPLLVYEFIDNGTLYEHLHDQSRSIKLSWKTRLRIATETAGALAYLHSAASAPIIHRDVKTMNILLDRNLVAKVSDFGASRIIPLDQTQLTTLVQGTMGYLDPEYFHTSQLTEKSDVYSFGVVLAELITGKKALSYDRPEADRNLAMYLVSSMKEGQLLHIVDKHIIDEANVEQLMDIANIARHCLKVNGEQRPTMKEVAMELEGLLSMEKHRWENVDLSSEETESLLKVPPSVFNVEDGASGSGTSNAFDSSNRISMSLGGGR